MESVLYSELADWYLLIDPAEEHEAEVVEYDRLLAGGVAGEFRTLLELGAGAGNNALFFKRGRVCTLTDLSPAMLDLSRRQNPECEHVPGDMRELRLGRTFDAVMIHDAVVHMRSLDDLRAAARTAFVHTRPGGAALFTPDCVSESFYEYREDGQHRDGDRTLQWFQWSWQPDPGTNAYRVDFAFLLREGIQVRAVHDHHTEGLFSVATWIEVLESVGYEVEVERRDFPELQNTPYTPDVFLARRPR